MLSLVAMLVGRYTLVEARPCRGGQDNEQDGEGGDPLHCGIARFGARRVN